MLRRQAVDGFIAMADDTTGNPNLILGSTQIQAMMCGYCINYHLRKLTLKQMFNNHPRIQDALRMAAEEEDRLIRRFGGSKKKQKTKKNKPLQVTS